MKKIHYYLIHNNDKQREEKILNQFKRDESYNVGIGNHNSTA